MRPIRLREDGLTEEGLHPIVAVLRQMDDEQRQEDAKLQKLRELWPTLGLGKDWDEVSDDMKRLIAKKI